MTLTDAAIAIASLTALMLVSGILFAVIAQPPRSRVSLWFAAFCVSLLLWSLVSLTGPFEELRFGLDEQRRAYLLATLIALSTGALYAFSYAYAAPQGRFARWLLLAAPLVLAGGIGLIWSGGVFTGSASVDGAADFRFQPLAGIALGAQFIYALAAFGIIMSGGQTTRPLRLPTALMLAAYSTLASPALLSFPLAILLATTAAAWMGYVVQRRILYLPLASVQDELRVANQDLRQALTDLAQERERSRQLMDQLEQAGRDRSRFIDDLAIKLRTQLTLVSGYSELMLTGAYGELSERQIDRMTRLNRSVVTLNSLIKHMLDLNRIEAGRMSLDRSLFPLRPVIDRAADSVEIRRTEKGVNLALEIPPDLPPLYGDSDRIEQVFTELLENAIKFTPARGEGTAPASITVRARLIHVASGRAAAFALPVVGWLGDGDWIVVEVIDQGIGIPSGEQARIFEEFTQLNPDSYEGSGMGLAICRRLIELHGGRIWVKSQPGQGSTFFVALRPAGERRQPAT
ncbi:MAG: sensor histidine kinase [Candidatus Flexifilum sp.]